MERVSEPERVGSIMPSALSSIGDARRDAGADENPIERERRRLDLERELQQRMAGLRQMQAIVPKRFHRARFETYRPRNETQQVALDSAREWVERAVCGQMALLALLGPTGTGKSHLLYSAAWELFAATNKNPLCLRWYRFPDELRYGRGPRDASGERQVRPWEVREEWEAAPICLIDEVRPTSGTTFDATEIARYALGVYDDEKALMMTCSRGELADLIGEEPANRFAIARLDGASYRDSAA